VDFTIANVATDTIKKAAKFGVNLIVGTTGVSNEQLKEINDIISENKVKAIIASNTAKGVNVFFKILYDITSLLADFDIEIIEAHDNKKVYSLSGTSMNTFEIISFEIDKNTNDIGVFGRKGNDSERTKNEIGIHVIRCGDINPANSVIFAGVGEHIEIKNVVYDHNIFIDRVIKSINFIENEVPGKIHSMSDVLGIDLWK
jgi:4-hydroxy-tetrahydrodipicolinate reductase